MKAFITGLILLGSLFGSTAHAEDPILFLRRSMQYDLWLLQRDYYRSLGPTNSPYSPEYERMLLETPTVWGSASANETESVSTSQTTAVANQGLTATEFFVIEAFPEFWLDLSDIDNDPYSDPDMIHLWYDTLYPLPC